MAESHDHGRCAQYGVSPRLKRPTPCDRPDECVRERASPDRQPGAQTSHPPFEKRPAAQCRPKDILGTIRDDATAPSLKNDCPAIRPESKRLLRAGARLFDLQGARRGM